MERFAFADREQWALVFGHMAEWRHPKWQKQCRSAARVNLSSFALALNLAAPCGSLAALRSRLSERCGSEAGQWACIAGAEGERDVSLSRWQWALQRLGVRHGDAAQLFALLALPSHSSDKAMNIIMIIIIILIIKMSIMIIILIIMIATLIFMIIVVVVVCS